MATKYDPEFTAAWINLASVQIQAQNYEKALEAAQEGVRLDPDFAMGHNNLAVAYFCNNDVAKAKQHVKKAQDLGYQVQQPFIDALEKEAEK